MWGPLISVIAGALMDGQKDQLQRQQAVAQMQEQFAQRLNPRLNTAPFQAAQLNRQLEEQRGESTSKLLAALGSSLVSDSATPKSSGYQLSSPLATGDYGPGYGYGAPPSFGTSDTGMGSSYQLTPPSYGLTPELFGQQPSFQLQTPRLLR